MLLKSLVSMSPESPWAQTFYGNPLGRDSSLVTFLGDLSFPHSSRSELPLREFAPYSLFKLCLKVNI